jgi:HlyD family secretion protein
MKPNIALVGAVLALIVVAAGCGSQKTGVLQGYVEGESVYVAAPLGGTLANLAVARGADVKAGQLLFELESEAEAAAAREADERLAQANARIENLRKGGRPTEIAALEAQIDQARAQFKLAEAEFARRQKLRAGDAEVISAEELDQARARRDAARASIEALSAELQTARLGAREDEVRAAEADAAALAAALERARWALDQKRQLAPADAQVQDTLYLPGEWVAAGRPVVSLLPPANIKVRFFVPQTQLASVEIGQNVAVSMDGAPRSYTATVNYISTQAEFTPPVIYSRENRAKLVFMIEAAFAPADAIALRPGQPVDVKLKP